MSDVDRIADSDRLLILRMQAEVAGAERLAAFVQNHLSATYKLQPGDRIEDDGSIMRAAAPEATE